MHEPLLHKGQAENFYINTTGNKLHLVFHAKGRDELGTICVSKYSETSIHRFCRGVSKRNNGSGKTDGGAIVEIGFTQGP
jgi:hypothetical protein